MPSPRHIAVMGGSFNPIHQGHLIIASWIVQHCPDIDAVWLMLSPRNPLKQPSHEGLMPTLQQRAEMIDVALAQSQLPISLCLAELDMPQPSYTINTLQRLSGEYPDCRFRLVIGSDNWAQFNRWRSYQEIISDYGLIVYPRPQYPIGEPLPDNVTAVDAPLIDISSTLIRQMRLQGLNVQYLVPQRVNAYIEAHHLYI